MLDTSDKKMVTLKEASKISGKSVSALRKLVQRGRLDTAEKLETDSGEKWYISEEECRTFAQKNKKPANKKPVKPVSQEVDNDSVQDALVRAVDRSIEKMLEVSDVHLFKPLEGQALFIAGRLTQENLHLKEKIEQLRQENRELKKQPQPAGEDSGEVLAEVPGEMAGLKSLVDNLKKENSTLTARLKEANLQEQLSRDELKSANTLIEKLRHSEKQLREQLEQAQASQSDFETVNKIRKLEASKQKLQKNLSEKVAMLEQINKRFAQVKESRTKMEEEMRKYKGMSERLEKIMEEAEKNIEEATAQIDTLTGENEELQDSIGRLTENNNNLRDDIQKKSNELEGLRLVNKKLESQLQSEQKKSGWKKMFGMD